MVAIDSCAAFSRRETRSARCCVRRRRRAGAAILQSMAAGFLLSNSQGRRTPRLGHIMRNAYIIEIQDEAVGIAAREGRGFRFHAAAHAFQQLDGRLFPSLQQANRAVQTVQKTAAGGGARAGGAR
jgi:hypothetical protein